MQSTKPLKRHKSLQPLSHDHHHSLLLCWKIRTGLQKQIEIKRIKRYTDWFYEQYLLPHFDLEEAHLFPILGMDHPLIKRALTEHRRLKRLFTSDTTIKRNLSLLEEELESHIRFEERILFQKIQKIAEENDHAAEHILDPKRLPPEHLFEENTEDLFWE